MNYWYISFICGVIIACGLFAGCLLINKEKDVEFMEQPVLIRHGAPTKYDEATLGTMCKVMDASGEKYDLWIQYSADETNPRWEYMGNFKVDDPHLCDNIDLVFQKEDPT